MARLAGDTRGIESPEYRLLLACARTRLGETEIQRIRSALETDLDWEYLLGEARRHRVALLLHHAISAASNDDSINSQKVSLREHSRAFAARNAYLARELTRLLERFETEKIPAIPYKGPLVAALAYGNHSLREFNDLDILIRPRDIPRACAALRDEGFETAARYTPREQAHIQREFKEYCFQSGLVVVEPHWSITARRFPFPIDYDALWSRAREASFCERTVRVLSPEDWLLILCVTGGKSCWRRLELVCDVAESIHAFPEIDWDAVQGSARETGSERMLLLALALAAELLDAHVPEDIANRIAADRQVARLKTKVVESWFRPRIPPDSRSRSARRLSSILMAMRERPSHRWAYAWRTLTTPTVHHIRRFPLPESLWPLYRLVVP